MTPAFLARHFGLLLTRNRAARIGLLISAALLACSSGELAAADGAAANIASASFVVRPAEVVLSGNLERAQLVVTASDAAGVFNSHSADLTLTAEYATSDPAVVTVNSTGRLVAAGNGEASILVKIGDTLRQVPVQVTDVDPSPRVTFTDHVLPIMSKAGCNAGACHASQYGKGGLILSVFGFDPAADRAMIVRDLQQRRVNFIQPTESLFLKKPTMQVPHGGSKRLDAGSIDYQLLTEWVAAGAPGPANDAPKVVSFQVTPNHRVGEIGFRQQLRVVATYNNGKTRDVTAWAKFDSMDDAVLSVTPQGMVTAQGKGQAPVMVRFEGQADISMVVVPYSAGADLAGWKEQNFIDHFAAQKFQELGITPSAVCDDATFVRRAFLDSIGTLPTAAESVAFIDSADPDKRVKLVERLLGLTGDPAQDIYNDQYAAFWTLKWSDLVRNDSGPLGEQGMWSLHNWLREQFRTNRPFDAFVRELVLGKGSVFSNGPANYYRIASNPADLAEATAQIFLGVRLQCAKCHHHPFEKYSQGDYYGFAAFFARVGNKSCQEFGLFGGESVVLVRAGGEVSHPRTGQRMPPTPLDSDPVEDNALDRRIPLASWLTSADNRLFARNVVNRYMGYVMGRGLVEEIDDMRATNPPSNPLLMDALADDFVKNGYNLKHLIRTIMTSRLYQLDSQPTESNASDRRFYSHYRVKRLAAEPLLDSLDVVTGTQTKFKSLPLGTRAIELPDAEYPDYFLTTFAKPKRASVCECERTPDENLTQALHTLNGDIIASKIADPKGRIATLAASGKSHDDIVTEIYLNALARRPSSAELQSSREYLSTSPSPKEHYEDLLWALINSKQYLFVH